MSDNEYKAGQADANKGLGQRDPNSSKSAKEREDYQAGWNKAQEDRHKKS